MDANKKEATCQTVESSTRAQLWRQDHEFKSNQDENEDDCLTSAMHEGHHQHIERSSLPQRKTSTAMRKYQEIKEDRGLRLPSAHSQHSNTKSEAQGAAVKPEPFRLPYENTIINYGHTKRQLSLIDRESILKLGQRLDQRFDRLLQREVEKAQERGREDKSLLFARSKWRLPSHIIAFTATKIQNLDSMQLKLQQWPQFKKAIFDVIDHRIEFAAEINGAINTSYVTLDEHLVIYIVHEFG